MKGIKKKITPAESFRRRGFGKVGIVSLKFKPLLTFPKQI
jgi:hypothetical protein